MQGALRRMRKFLHDLDLNFFIHTTPLRGNYDYYHWHIEIRPHITDFGGFEIGTGMDVNTVDPVKAADILRGKKQNENKNFKA